MTRDDARARLKSLTQRTTAAINNPFTALASLPRLIADLLALLEGLIEHLPEE